MIRSWAEQFIKDYPEGLLANAVMKQWPHLCATIVDYDERDHRDYERRMPEIMNGFHKDVMESLTISPEDFVVCINYPFDGKLVIGTTRMEDVIYLRMVSTGGGNVELTGNWEGNE